MARQEGPESAQVYTAAEQWVDRCLRQDDSLFTPGRAVWTAAVVEDLNERFVKKPDETDRDFMTKLRDQLAGAPAETVQLSAELLYVHFLIARSVKGDTKRRTIHQVMSWSSETLSMPEDLAAALDPGIANCGTGFNTYRPFLLMHLIEFARMWKRTEPTERVAALEDPWEFKRLVFTLKGTAVLLQQNALLHLVHPDTFEDIVANEHKYQIANAPAYSQFVTNPEADVDRRLLEIRRGIEKDTGTPLRFYDDQHYPTWRPQISYWKISPGEDGWQWDECLREGFIAMGWDRFGDVSRMSREEFNSTKERLTQELNWGTRGPDRVWDFAHLKPGDRVIANQGTSAILGFGTVTGPYYFVPQIRHGHRVPVRWDDVDPRQISELGWRSTMIKIDKEKFERLIGAPSVIEDQESAAGKEVSKALKPTAGGSSTPVYTIAQCAEDIHLPLTLVDRWVSALNRKGQAVLYGPPGTGKTYVASHLARLLAASDGLVQLVQFHPSYAYEDFVQGIRPQTGDGGRLEYPTVPGRFLEFCDVARERSGLCVLVLDEMNRANLARVFGELMYLLEYRDSSIPLAGGRDFSIPKNVRLIGTMNTADRSIALVDHALRRRFAFFALYPDYDILRRFHQGGGEEALVDGLAAVLEELNKQMGDRHFHVGMSFFLLRDLSQHIEDIWRMEIEPYLEEFFFDQPERVAAFRWDRIRQRLGR